MKETKNRDLFKDQLRDKMDDSPVHKNQEEELWSRVMGEIEESEKNTRKLSPNIWYAIAATLLIGLFAVIFYLQNTRQKAVAITNENSKITTNQSTEKISDAKVTSTKETEESSPLKKNKISSPEKVSPTVIAAIEDVKEYKLSDGSRLTLNKESSIKIKDDFSSSRSVTMEGEVYFEIAPDKEHPFDIYFDNHRLQVIGTRFNIRNIDAENFKEVTVTEGIVKIFPNNAGKGIEVKAGEQLILSINEPVIAKVESYNFIFWKTGIIDFKNSPMEQVSILLSRKYKYNFSLNSAINNCTFTGDLTQLSLDEAIRIIEISTPFKVEKKKHEIHISGKGCK